MEKRKQSPSSGEKRIIVIIGCGKEKRRHKTKAKFLYCGIHFKKCLCLAKQITDEENIFIFSAKYGLIELEKEIHPYDIKLTNLLRSEREEWVQTVNKQIKEMGLNKTQFVFICSPSYHKYFKGITLLPKLRMGLQMKWMTQKIKEQRCTLFTKELK